MRVLSSPGRPGGFTLLELLVVLGLTLALAALLFPLLGRGRDAAARTRCLANLRGIGTATLAFAAERDGELPASAYGGTTVPSNPTTAYKWMDAVFPYAPDERLFLCPADPGARYVFHQRLRADDPGTDYGSYGLNGAYRNLGDAQTPPRSTVAQPIRLSMITEPARTVLAADTANRQEANGSFGFTWADAASAPRVSATRPRQLEKIIERHDGRANVLFCDGHAEPVSLDDLTRTRNVPDPATGATQPVMPVFTIEAD